MSTLLIPLRAVLVALVAALACLAGTTTPAQADAIGCAYRSTFNMSVQGQTVPAPSGYLCHQILGDGKLIQREVASYAAAPSLLGALNGRMCNWRIDFVYRDGYGTTYRTDQGPITYGCSYGVSRIVEANKTLAHYGTACARLIVNNTTRVQQCHNIQP